MSRKGSPPSAKQMFAIIRNDKVRRLRGIAATARGIEMPQADRNRILMGVDGALRFYKADSESEHRKKQLSFIEKLETIAGDPNG